MSSSDRITLTVAEMREQLAERFPVSERPIAAMSAANVVRAFAFYTGR